MSEKRGGTRKRLLDRGHEKIFVRPGRGQTEGEFAQEFVEALLGLARRAEAKRGSNEH